MGAAPGAAETHGLLCGMVSTPGEPDRARWIAHVLDGTHLRGEEAKQCLAVMTTLFDETRQALEDPELRFQPLLPDDEAPIEERAVALGDWCQGYLAGLGLGGLSKEKALPKEITEVLRDFGEIAQVEPAAVAGDDNEAAYAELHEYVRVGALLILEHASAPARPPKKPRERDRRLH